MKMISLSLVRLKIMFCAIFLCYEVRAENILVLTAPIFSHFLPTKGLVDILVETYKHNVTYLVPTRFIEKDAVKKLMNSKVNYLLNDHDGRIYDLCDSFASECYEVGFENKGIQIQLSAVKNVTETITHLFMEETQIITELRRHKFQTVIIDGLFSLPFLILAERLKIPEVVYLFLTITPNVALKIPADYLSTPENIFVSNNGPFTFNSRLKNYFVRMMTMLFSGYGLSFLFPEDVINKYVPVPERDNFYEKLSYYSFYLLDQDAILDYTRPTQPNIAMVGGLSLTANINPLTDEFVQHINSADHGIIVVTFGSKSKHLPKRFKSILYQTFRMIPELNFFVKVDEYFFKEGNILQTPWLPQGDLLAQKSTKAFITHCGNNGQYEALFHGVPMVAIPIFADQFNNAEKVSAKLFGVKLDLNTLTVVGLINSIKEVVDNKTYKQRIEKASEIYRSKPLNASQTAAYWVHHVTKFGSLHLRSPSQLMPTFQTLGIDLILFVFTVYSFILCIIFVIMRSCCRCICNRKIKRD